MGSDPATLRRIGRFGKGALLLGAVLAIGARRAAAQGAARWVEESRTTVTAHTAAADRQRTLVRHAVYATTVRGDTLVLQVASLELTETADGTTTAWDTDGFVGGFWKLVAGRDGSWRVVERPFVPPALATVSDLGRIGEDFFPAAPPALAVGARATVAGRDWQREADREATRRYRWSFTTSIDTTEIVADSTPVHRTARVEEHGEGGWDAKGPVEWNRRLEEATEARFLGRAVRATAVTMVNVRREEPGS